MLNRPLKLFISYSEKDESYIEEFIKHLAVLQRERLVDHWHQRRIQAGEDTSTEIAMRLEEADIIVIAISSDFLASESFHDGQLLDSLARHQKRSARVVPLVLRPADWASTDLRHLQPLPKGGVPISKWPDRDDAWLNVVREIRQIVEEYRQGTTIAGENRSFERMSNDLDPLHAQHAPGSPAAATQTSRAVETYLRTSLEQVPIQGLILYLAIASVLASSVSLVLAVLVMLIALILLFNTASRSGASTSSRRFGFTATQTPAALLPLGVSLFVAGVLAAAFSSNLSLGSSDRGANTANFPELIVGQPELSIDDDSEVQTDAADSTQDPDAGIVGARTSVSAGVGRLGGSHRTKPPSVKMGATSVSGRLPQEVIYQIVFRQADRFRQCFQNGSRSSLSAQGAVSVLFTIGRDGNVTDVKEGGSDIDDHRVISCIVDSFRSLTFPEPEGGIVTVRMPIRFRPVLRSSTLPVGARLERDGGVTLQFNDAGALESFPSVQLDGADAAVSFPKHHRSAGFLREGPSRPNSTIALPTSWPEHDQDSEKDAGE